MSRFRYRAATRTGQVTAGVVGAATLAEADERLVASGLHPLTVEPAARARPGRIPSRDLRAATRSVATLVQVGVPVERALATTARLPLAAPLVQAIGEIRGLLAEGQSLTMACEAAGLPLEGPHLGLLKAGERGGRLGPALEALATTLEREEELRGRIRQALAYPAVLLVAGLASVAVIAGLIVPRFAEILADLGTALPSSTRLLLAVAGLVQAHGLAMLAALGAAGALVTRWARTPSGAATVSRTALTLPVVGAVRHGFAAARATGALGALLASGAPILAALAAAEEATGDIELAGRLARARERVARGESLGHALAMERAFPPAAEQLLAVGESTGHLPAMADRAAQVSAREAEARLCTLVSLIEPLLVLLIGGFVAFVAVALLQAVYSLRPVG